MRRPGRAPSFWTALAFWTVLAFSTVLASPACLADLEEPSLCPPEPARPLGDCSDVAIEYPFVGCAADDQITCINGGRESCECQAGECPTGDGACYPSGDCPPLVLDSTGDPSAQCVRIREADYGLPEFGPAFHCTCGCAECMSVCDGRGPVFVVRSRKGEMAPLPIPPMVIEELMPDEGRFGVYVRARGAGAMVVGAFAGPPDNAEALVPLNVGNIMTLEPVDAFAERVFFRNAFDSTVYSWTEPAAKPTVLVLTGLEPDPAEPTDPETRDLLVEIDCVVPFHVPEAAP